MSSGIKNEKGICGLHRETDFLRVTREFGLFSTLRKMSSVVFLFIVYNCYALNIS